MAKRSPNYPEDEIVKFSVIRTSDAVIKEVSTPIVFVVRWIDRVVLTLSFSLLSRKGFNAYLYHKTSRLETEIS